MEVTLTLNPAVYGSAAPATDEATRLAYLTYALSRAGGVCTATGHNSFSFESIRLATTEPGVPPAIAITIPGRIGRQQHSEVLELLGAAGCLTAPANSALPLFTAYQLRDAWEPKTFTTSPLFLKSLMHVWALPVSAATNMDWPMEWLILQAILRTCATDETRSLKPDSNLCRWIGIVRRANGQLPPHLVVVYTPTLLSAHGATALPEMLNCYAQDLKTRMQATSSLLFSSTTRGKVTPLPCHPH